MAEQLTLAISKKMILDMVKPFYKKEGFKYISGGAPAFVKKTDYGYVDIDFTFSSDGDAGFSKIGLCLDEVEIPLLEIGVPQPSSLQYGEGMWRILTVADDSNNIKDSLNIPKLQTVEHVRTFTQAVIDYMKNDSLVFVERYKHLPTVLPVINNIIKEGRPLNEILRGGSGSYFKVLVISKLCNDPHFEEKLAYCDNKFLAPERARWVTYYEKLKAMLPSIKPKYNI